MIEWTDNDHHFCEGKINGLPEYYNAYSSIFICIFGLIGLFLSKYNDIRIQILYSLLFTTGIGSFLYHYTAYKGWAHVDELSMLTSAGLGILFSFDTYLYFYNKIKGYDDMFFGQRLFILLMSFLMIFISCLSIMESHRIIFPVYFSVMVFICAYIFYKLYRIEKEILKKEYDNVEKFCKLSIFISILSGFLWIATELSCDYINSTILLIGHPLWHICSSYACYCIIQILLYFRIIQIIGNKNNVYFKKNSIYEYLPIVMIDNIK